MINNTVLTGRITRDPEIKSTGQSGSVCSFTLAVNRTFKNQQGEYEADFINCVAFNNTAQRMQQYVRKGNLLGVTGRIQTRNYENKMGQRVYITEVIASNVTFLENNNKQQSSGYPDPYASGPSPYDGITDDDLPF